MRRRTRILQQVAPTPGIPSSAPMTLTEELPSAFMAALSASGGILIVGGALALVYDYSVLDVLPIAAAPWAVLVVGKVVYLVLILVDDIRSIFGPGVMGPSKSLLPISKED
mgnify:CR=1 FL=1